MHKKLITYILVLSSALLLSGCQSFGSRHDTAALALGEINGKSEFFSVTQSNTPKSFIDLGSALSWRNSQCILHQTAFDGGAKVADYYTGEMIPVKEAVYVSGAGISTPSGHDMVALKKIKSAMKFLTDSGNGEILTFDEILTRELK